MVRATLRHGGLIPGAQKAPEPSERARVLGCRAAGAAYVLFMTPCQLGGLGEISAA